MELVAAGILDRRLFLGQDYEHAIELVGASQRGHGPWSPDQQGKHEVGEEHQVPERDDRQALGNLDLVVYPVKRGHSEWAPAW